MIRFLLLSSAVCIIFFLQTNCSKDEELNDKDLLLYEVNKVRREGCKCGQDNMPPVRELTWNNELEKAAFLHTKDMYDNNYFSHFGLNNSTPMQRSESAGYDGSAVGEILAKDYTNVSSVMKAWLASESHCRTIMDSVFQELGSARYNNYWVQEFGKRNPY